MQEMSLLLLLLLLLRGMLSGTVAAIGRRATQRGRSRPLGGLHVQGGRKEKEKKGGDQSLRG